MVIPNNNKQEIYESAERFRRIVEAFEINNVGRITISIGIASWPDSAEEFAQVLKIADNNLYYARIMAVIRLNIASYNKTTEIICIISI